MAPNAIRPRYETHPGAGARPSLPHEGTLLRRTCFSASSARACRVVARGGADAARWVESAAVTNLLAAAGGHTYDGRGFVSSGILVFSIPPDSRAIPTYRLTFTKAGTYTYRCLVHPGMDGVITVLPAGA